MSQGPADAVKSEHHGWASAIRQFAPGAVGSFSASFACYVIVCLISGRNEAWDVSDVYVPLIIVAPAVIGFVWPRLVFVTSTFFVMGQPAASIVWGATGGQTDLAWWPMAVLFTTPLFVVPIVIPSALIGTALRMLLSRIAERHEGKGGERG